MGLFSSLGGIIGNAIGGGSNNAHDRINEGLGTAGGMLTKGLQGTEARIQPMSQYAPDVLSRLNNTIMNGDMSGFYNSPDYAYNRDESMRGIQANAAAQGTLMSGNTLKALQKNASGLASQNYGSYINNLNSLFNQSNPYYQQYSQIPYLQGQNDANIQLKQTENMGQAAAEKGAQWSQLGSAIGGIGDMFTGQGFGGGSMMGSPTQTQGWAFSNGSMGGTDLGNAMPWLQQNGNFRGFA